MKSFDLERHETQARFELKRLHATQQLQMSFIGCIGTAVIQGIVFLFFPRIEVILLFSMLVGGWFLLWRWYLVRWRKVHAVWASNLGQEEMTEAEDFLQRFPTYSNPSAPQLFLVGFLLVTAICAWLSLVHPKVRDDPSSLEKRIDRLEEHQQQFHPQR